MNTTFDRRRLLGAGLTGASLFVLNKLTGGLGLPQAMADELQPFCSHVSNALGTDLRNNGCHVAACQHCLDLYVGGINVNLFDSGWVDTDPGMEASESKSLNRLRRRELQTLFDALEAGLTDHGFSVSSDAAGSVNYRCLQIHGKSNTFIWKIIEDTGGQRFLTYSRDGKPWWEDEIPDHVVGFLLGGVEPRAMAAPRWNRSYADRRGRWDPVGTFADQIGRGRLSIQGNALLMLT